MVTFTGRGHISLTLVLLYLMNPALEPRAINLWLITGAVIGSLLPDCDSSHSFAGQILPIWLLGVKRRAQTHSLLAAAAVSLLGVFMAPKFGLGIGLGYILHLAGDRMTYMGQRRGLPYFLWYPGRKMKKAGQES